MADHPLAGPVYTGTVIRTPKRMLTGSGAPSFCWQCGNQLQRAPGKGAGLFFFNLVTGPDGQPHRIHGDCTEQAILDGCKLCSSPGVKVCGNCNGTGDRDRSKCGRCEGTGHDKHDAWCVGGERDGVCNCDAAGVPDTRGSCSVCPICGPVEPGQVHPKPGCPYGVALPRALPVLGALEVLERMDYRIGDRVLVENFLRIMGERGMWVIENPLASGVDTSRADQLKGGA